MAPSFVAILLIHSSHGGKASHVALECTLQSHPNMVILGEEVAASKLTLFDITKQLCDAVQARKSMVFVREEFLLRIFHHNFLPGHLVYWNFCHHLLENSFFFGQTLMIQHSSPRYDREEGKTLFDAVSSSFFGVEESTFQKKKAELAKKLMLRDGSLMTLAQSRKLSQLTADNALWEDRQLLRSGAIRGTEV